MEQLIYISTSRAPLRVPQDDIDSILAVSRSNNARDGLSGLLLVGGRRFLQVLEGPRQALDATYARIAADPRHFAVVQLSRRPIEQRSFPGWAMGFESEGEKLSAIVAELTAAVRDPMLRAQMEGFASIHSSAA